MIEYKKILIKNRDIELVNIKFNIESSLAVVGQSGSGKSLTLKAILNLLPKNLNSEINFNSNFDLNNLSNIGFVPQNPFTALSPMSKIKEQFFADKDDIEESLKLVNLDIDLIDRFPLELSGGQLQRIVIAMAIIKKPKLLLLDEPTTALDNNTKKSILELIKNLQSSIKFYTLFVTHDIFSIKEICKNILIIKNGKIVEYGDSSEILSSPKNSYTQKLIESSFENREFRK